MISDYLYVLMLIVCAHAVNYNFFDEITSIDVSSMISGYVQNKSLGVAYKLQYLAQPWGIAKFTCEQESAKLAVPKSKAEFAYLQSMVRSMRYKNIVSANELRMTWLGISNIDDHTVWTNVDGENIEHTGFHTWAGDNGESFNSDSAEPHCVAVDAVNPGLRVFWCHYRLPYICQIDI